MITLDNITLADAPARPAYASGTLNLADGAVVVQADAQQTGRPITLQGGDNFGWIDKATLELLRLKARDAGLQMTLTMHNGVTHNVVFTADRLSATPVVDYSNPANDDYYTVTLYLMEL